MRLPAWMRFTGSAATAPPPAAAEQRPDMSEYGATGTPIFGGFLRELGEYNPDLSGLAAYSTYEKMRRGDAQVAATLTAIKLPIRGAEWTVAVPEDASDVEKAAAEFIEHCLFDLLSFDGVLENALLMLDFGAAAHEDVWAIENNLVVPAKLAPRLPLTFYRWICEAGGDELTAIEQLGYRGGQYITAQVPLSKLALFTYRQEGANFAGRSLCREMYQHWYIKSNLYKIDAIACERNGMGVPWATMGPDAKSEDRVAALNWLQQLSTHEKAAILTPPGWTWGFMGVTGATRDPKESIAHHNLMISMAGLAQFMMLGTTGGGNRALGKTMSDFFYMSLQATADRIARTITLSTIKRLVDFNFAGIVNYPKLVPQQILSVSFEGLVEALRFLAMDRVDAIRPDDDLEAWLRQQMGAPKMGEPRLPRPTAVNEAVTATPADVEEPDNAPGADSKKFSEADGPKLKRAAVGAERYLALREIVSALDKGRDDVAAALRAARSRVQAEIVNKLVSSPVRNMHRVSIAADEKLTAAIEEVLQGVYGFGVAQVSAEKQRQRAGAAPSDAATVRMTIRVRLAEKRNPLGVYADGVVSEFTNTLTGRAANVALDYARRPAGRTKGEIIRQIENDLDDQSDKWIDGAASKGANEAFADGRADGYAEHADEISEVQYSALLDLNTCENCAAADGQTGATPDDIPDVPNPDCDGGDKCRCVHVFVFGDEQR